MGLIAYVNFSREWRDATEIFETHEEMFDWYMNVFAMIIKALTIVFFEERGGFLYINTDCRFLCV